MDGQPVWLCSVSRGRRGETLATKNWTKGEFTFAEGIAHDILDGVGNPECERAFRMNITFCIHRALSGPELFRLPHSWRELPGGLAGGPVEVLWSCGILHREAAMPCHRPGHLVFDKTRPDLWIPEDCGECPPCVARERIHSSILLASDNDDTTEHDDLLVDDGQHGKR